MSDAGHGLASLYRSGHNGGRSDFFHKIGAENDLIWLIVRPPQSSSAGAGAPSVPLAFFIR